MAVIASRGGQCPFWPSYRLSPRKLETAWKSCVPNRIVCSARSPTAQGLELERLAQPSHKTRWARSRTCSRPTGGTAMNSPPCSARSNNSSFCSSDRRCSPPGLGTTPSSTNWTRSPACAAPPATGASCTRQGKWHMSRNSLGQCRAALRLNANSHRSFCPDARSRCSLDGERLGDVQCNQISLENIRHRSRKMQH